MSLKSEKAEIIFAISFLIFAIAAVIASISKADEIIGGYLLLLFQIAFGILCVCLIYFIITQFFISINKKIFLLRKEFHQEIEQLKKRRPTIVAAFLIMGQYMIIIADKGFQGKPVPTIIISIFLLILFWIANELQIDDSKRKKLLGFVIWFIGLLTLPIAIFIHSEGNISNIIILFNGFESPTNIIIAIVLLSFIIIPFAFIKYINRA